MLLARLWGLSLLLQLLPLVVQLKRRVILSMADLLLTPGYALFNVLIVLHPLLHFLLLGGVPHEQHVTLGGEPLGVDGPLG